MAVAKRRRARPISNAGWAQKAARPAGWLNQGLDAVGHEAKEKEDKYGPAAWVPPPPLPPPPRPPSGWVPGFRTLAPVGVPEGGWRGGEIQYEQLTPGDQVAHQDYLNNPPAARPPVVLPPQGSGQPLTPGDQTAHQDYLRRRQASYGQQWAPRTNAMMEY